MTNMERLDKAIKKECARLGISYNETKVPIKDVNGQPMYDKDGNAITRTVRTITNISDEAREVLEVFNMNTPCWFKGCE